MGGGTLTSAAGLLSMNDILLVGQARMIEACDSKMYGFGPLTDEQMVPEFALAFAFPTPENDVVLVATSLGSTPFFLSFRAVSIFHPSP